MKKSLLTVFGIFLCFSPTSSFAEEESALVDAMDQINSLYKRMRNIENIEEGPELARAAQKAVLIAYSELPEMVEEIKDPEEKQIAAAKYRSLIAGLLVTVSEVEFAFLTKDEKSAKKLVMQMRSWKREGHKLFKEDHY